MTDTAPPPPPLQEGPQVTASQLLDTRRLRRVRTGRSLAGVCGGLGRHFDLDPTIFRVLMVVLVFFGGAGLILYAALWLLMPDEATGRATLDLGDDVGKVLIIVAAVVAVVIVLGHGWGGWWFGPSLPLGILALGAIGYLMSRDRRHRGARPDVAAAITPPFAAPVAPPAVSDETAPLGAPTTTAPPAWSPPTGTPPPYTPPRRPKRTGPLLFWPTMAAVAVALGSLGVYDAGHHVATGAYWALALAIIGLALVVGAFRGRPGGLVLAALVTTAGLLGSLVVGGVRGTDDLSYVPTSAADVQSGYTLANGQLQLDLTRVADLSALDGRTVTMRGNVGELQVWVPRGLSVRVAATVRTVGGIHLGSGYDRGGVGGTGASRTLRGDPGAPTLTLDADLRIGQIDVRYIDE